MKFKVWSNFFFLIPFVSSIQLKINLYSLVLGLVIVFSVLFHWNNEKKYKLEDALASLGLVTFNFYLLFRGGISSLYSLVALTCAGVAICLYYKGFSKNYNFTHGVWHILSAIVCYFSILAFI